MGKERIIREIQRTAAANGGVPFGQVRFAEETGIGRDVWRGTFWRTWGDALAEAGFAPNLTTEAHPRDELIVSLAALARKYGRFPTYSELRMAKRDDPSFPTHHAFHRLGDHAARIELVRTYASEHREYRDVLDVLPPAEGAAVDGHGISERGRDGAVYMLKLGKHYKIGKSFSVPRRHKEIAIELPEKPDVVHVISTDDPTGIEAYWHKRFAEKNTNGEWFALTRDDVQAFKRRRFM
jgi:Meiotically up-regulated gene 113